MLTKRDIFLTASVAVSIALGIGVLWYVAPPKPKGASVYDGRLARAIESERTSVAANPKDAPKVWHRIVEAHQSVKDPEVQQEVAAARMRLAFHEARSGDYGKARAAFLKTKASYEGPKKMSQDFGGIADQAAYQAAVCLNAQGNTGAATKEFETFLSEHWDSPLIHAAHKRLSMIQGGTTPQQDALLERATLRQQEKIAFEASVCGPKVVEYLLPKLQRKPVPYTELAKEMGTGKTGTSMLALRDAFLSRGIQCTGVEVAPTDLRKVKLPAILHENGHFWVIEQFDANTFIAYDTRYGTRTRRSMPDPDRDPALSMLVFNEPTFARSKS